MKRIFKTAAALAFATGATYDVARADDPASDVPAFSTEQIVSMVRADRAHEAAICGDPSTERDCVRDQMMQNLKPVVMPMEALTPSQKACMIAYAADTLADAFINAKTMDDGQLTDFLLEKQSKASQAINGCSPAMS